MNSRRYEILMAEWDWLNEPGNVGELPVRILENQRAEFILDFAEGTRIDSYSLASELDLSPGDICILKVEIMETSEIRGQTVLNVNVFDVEMIQEAGESESPYQEGSRNPEGDSKVKEMMEHLDEARAHRKQEMNKNRCSNCQTVTGSTNVTIEERIVERDLHYCDQCGHLLSTKEYERWKNEHGW